MENSGNGSDNENKSDDKSNKENVTLSINNCENGHPTPTQRAVVESEQNQIVDSNGVKQLANIDFRGIPQFSLSDNGNDNGNSTEHIQQAQAQVQAQQVELDTNMRNPLIQQQIQMQGQTQGQMQAQMQVQMQAQMQAQLQAAQAQQQLQEQGQHQMNGFVQFVSSNDNPHGQQISK